MRSWPGACRAIFTGLLSGLAFACAAAPATLEQAVFERNNALRVSNDRPALREDPRLAAAARDFARKHADTGVALAYSAARGRWYAVQLLGRAGSAC